MGSTPIHNLPWPEPSVNANGPVAFQNLATKVEQKMPAVTGTFVGGGGAEAAYLRVNRGATGVLHTGSFTSWVNGWQHIELDIHIYVNEQACLPSGSPYMSPGAPWAGLIRVYNGGTLLKTRRFHSMGRTANLQMQFGAWLPHAGSGTPHTFRVDVLNDENSAGAIFVGFFEWTRTAFGSTDDDAPV